MTAEQLEELLRDAYCDDQKKWESAWYELRLNCDHLARRVIAAEKLQYALVCAFTGDGSWEAVSDASSEYNEASK